MTATYPARLAWELSASIFLREGGARDHFHADRADALRREGVDEIVLVEGIEKANVDATFTKFRDFFGRWLSQAQDQSGLGERCVAVADDRGACFRVGIVRVLGGRRPCLLQSVLQRPGRRAA